jgi:flagellar hook-basal body complex protein FliE
MSNAINGLGIPPMPSSALTPGGSTASTAAGPAQFQNMLLDSLNHVDAMQQSAQSAVERGLIDGDVTQVEALTSMKKADLALRLMLQVRNKIMDAYQEIQQIRM